MIFPTIPDNFYDNVEENVNSENEILENLNTQNILYDFKNKDFPIIDGKFITVTGQASTIFWIEKLLRTQLNSNLVYENTNFGVDIDRMVGKVGNRKVIQAILREEIKTALLTNEMIENVSDFNMNVKDEKMELSFKVKLKEISKNQQIEYKDDNFKVIDTIEKMQEFLPISNIESNSFTFNFKE